jgi:hypothetical protein
MEKCGHFYDALLTVSLVFFLLSSTLAFIAVPGAPRGGTEGLVYHDAANVKFEIDSKGRFPSFIYMNSNIQDGFGFSTGDGNTFLVFDQTDYDHQGQVNDIATYSDFEVTENDTQIHMLRDNGPMDFIEKSYCSFTQTGIIQSPNDVRISQTVWTKVNENWAIIRWDVQNLLDTDITGVRMALHYKSALDNYAFDDWDHWDDGNSTYWINNTSGLGNVLGFSSPDPSLPINLYYGDSYPNLAWAVLWAGRIPRVQDLQYRRTTG